MSNKLRDRARKAQDKTPKQAEKRLAKEVASKADKTSTTPAKEEVKADTSSQPVTSKSPASEVVSTPPEEDNVVEMAEHVADGLSDDQVAEILARVEAEEDAKFSTDPFVARLAATRQTKTRQIQYDGVTPEGYIVRVWAPEGMAMVTYAELEAIA